MLLIFRTLRGPAALRTRELKLALAVLIKPS
jgi:hypothetical protein